MSIEKFLFNGTEQAVSKTAFAADVTDELYPRTVVTFRGETSSSNAECDMSFEDIAAAYASGSNLVLLYEDLDVPSGEPMRTFELQQIRYLDSNGSLVALCGTHVDAQPMFHLLGCYFPTDTYVDYSNDGLMIGRRDEGPNDPIS